MNVSQAPTTLSLEGITKIYRSGVVEVHALKPLSLAVAAGEFVALVGASGSGKSTLLNILGTLDRPTAGKYLLDGVRVDSLNDRALASLRNRKIGFVFQQFHLLPRATARENVELPMVYARIPAKVRRQRAEEALADVGLGDRMTHRPSELSGGQQQRVAIARAIVMKPSLLLADEPTGALDSENGVKILELFCSLHRRGLSIVLVTHDAKVAEQAERTIAMRDGEVVADERNRHGSH